MAAIADALWESQFPSFRAVDGDEEEEVEMSPERKLQLTPSWLWSPKIEEDLRKSNSNVFECKTLVLAIGEVSSTFVQAYFLCGENSEIIAAVSKKHDQKDFTSVLNGKPSDKVTLVHRLSNNQDTVVCQCRTNIDKHRTFLWTEKIFEKVKPSKVIILTSDPVSRYISSDPESLPPDFLRAKCTTEWLQDDRKLACELLETPNSVRGLAAAVLKQCEVSHMPLVIYKCYTATQLTDVQAVKGFGVLLESNEFAGLKKSSSEETTKVLKSLGIGISPYDHLYI